MKQDKKYKLIGALLALFLHGGIAAAMFFLYLTAPNEAEPPLDTAKSEITFGGEFVKLGDLPIPDTDDGEGGPQTSDDQTQAEGSDDADEGESGEGEALVTDEEESEATAPKRHNGPSEAEKKEQERIRKEKERQERERSNINNRTSNAFNRNNGGRSGSTNGNSSAGSLQGQAGHDLGANYKLEGPRTSCKKSGTIKIRVVVRQDGTIKSASYFDGSGEAAADRSIRRQFESYTKTLRFKVTGNAPAEKTGVITWVIRN